MSEDACIDAISPRGLVMINWCIWHFRFGQHRESSFIMSKVHVLYFVKDPAVRTWNPGEILELSDRASIYFDPRTMAKDENKGRRVPMDVWYGRYWGRIQGNNKERRHQHHNQLPEIYLERVIRACSNPGDLVLDPFIGSGTTSTVARAPGRRSIGIEYSPTRRPTRRAPGSGSRGALRPLSLRRTRPGGSWRAWARLARSALRIETIERLAIALGVQPGELMPPVPRRGRR